MKKDKIIEKTRKSGELLAKRAGFDLHQLIEYLNKRGLERKLLKAQAEKKRAA